MIICSFCQTSVPPAPIQSLAAFGIDVYFCYTCNAEYVDYKNKITVSLYTSIEDKLYRWSIYDHAHRLYSYKTFGIPGKSVNTGAKLLATLPPSDIHPHNVRNKIKLFLTFI